LSIVPPEDISVLKFIRRNASAPWVKLIFVAIVVVFVFWGMGGIVRGQKGQFVARVNGNVIEPADFYRAYNNLLRLYQEIYKDNFKPELAKTLDLKDRAVDQLIRVSLVRQEAEHVGLRVAEAELRDAIAALPTFQQDGHFNKELYLRALRANNLTPGDFEESEREELLVNKLQDLITSGVHVSDAELRSRYEFDNEKIDLRFIKLDAPQFMSEVRLTPDDAQTYYEKSKESFREPERVRIEYILYAPDKFEDKVQISDADVQEYYDNHLAEYETPEQVHARHILLKVPPKTKGEQKAQIRQRAEAVLAKVKAGEDFAKLAEQYSEDSTAAEGGNLGSFPRGKMVKPFDDAAFALAPGQTSGIVESKFGFHIIKVEDREDARTEPIDEVRPQVVAALRQEKARALAQTQANADRAKVAGGAALADIAGSQDLAVAAPGPFAQSEGIGTLGRLPQLAAAAFAANAGESGPVTDTPKGFVLFRVTERIASHIPELTEIRDRVESALRNERAQALAKSKADAILAELPGSDIDSVAKSHGFAIEETGPFGRQATTIPKLGSSPDLQKAAFQLTPEKPVAPAVYTVSGSSVVAVLKERTPADASKFESEKEDLRRRTGEQRKRQAMEDFVNYLKARASIQLGEEFLASVADSGHELGESARQR
jgi:peptidyl-prolyl cis-trans isomerase D